MIHELFATSMRTWRVRQKFHVSLTISETCSIQPLLLLAVRPKLKGKWKMLRCGNRSMETEVQKWEEKLPIGVHSSLLTYNCVCWGLVAKGVLLYPCDVRAGSSNSRTAASITITMHMTAIECSQTQTKTDSEWANQWCGLYAPDVLVTVIQTDYSDNLLFSIAVVVL